MGNTGAGYGWGSLSQWDTPPKDAHIESRMVNTGLSKAVCSFMLVNRTDQGGGYLRCEYVKKSDVTPEILKAAGEVLLAPEG
jgi:hypothetical protein